jgi:hypothetical protein
MGTAERQEGSSVYKQADAQEGGLSNDEEERKGDLKNTQTSGGFEGDEDTP